MKRKVAWQALEKKMTCLFNLPFSMWSRWIEDHQPESVASMSACVIETRTVAHWPSSLPPLTVLTSDEISNAQ